MKKITELSDEISDNMMKYSQIIIDLVDEAEHLFNYKHNEESFGALSYNIYNVLEVIDKNRQDDINILNELSKILRDEIVKLSKID